MKENIMTILSSFSLANTFTIAQKRALIKELRAEIAVDINFKKHEAFAKKELRAQERAKKQLAAADKRVLAELKLQDRIAKAQLRLQKLQDKKAKPVGSKAIKANRKASKVTILQAEAAEANAIAAKFAAKKQVA